MRWSAVQQRLLENPSILLGLVVMVLAATGLINLWAMSSPSFIGVLFMQQLLWLGLSVLAAVLVVLIDPRIFERQGYLLYALGLVALGAVLVLGESIRGARRWLDFVVFHIQPSELIKLLLVIALAKHSANNPRGDQLQTARQMLVPLLLTGLPMALILLQPDLSASLIVALIAFSLVLIAGLRFSSIAKLGGLASLSIPLVWFFALRSYQRARLLAFLEPADDVLGSDWQARQSIIAIGSGGWSGRGLSQSTQITFVPCHHDDLPFAVFCEEHGFFGAIVVLFLFLSLCLLCLRVSRAARDRFCAMVAAGVAVMVFWQVLVNIGVTLGVLPSTGVALPFFSTGGSALVTTMLGLGLVVSIARQRKRSDAENPQRSG